jgi:hypothetical protein
VFQVRSYKHKRSVDMGWVLMTKVPLVRSHSTTSVNLSWSFVRSLKVIILEGKPMVESGLGP